MHVLHILSDAIKPLIMTIAGVLSTISLIAVAIFMLCLSSESIASDYQSNYEVLPAVNKSPIRVGTWALTPTVIVCDHAPVSKHQVLKAITYWKDLGHRFYSTQYKHDPLNKCRNSMPIGYVVIHLVSNTSKMEETSLAETHFFVNNDSGRIEWAKIYLKSDVRETVLEHEIGHALGYLHHDKINHMMNSKWMYGGWDSDGLKNN
mgnify:FL=1|tara:strand:- start:826 stop:1440 length:615 start_codon:yes stop_codon:yes gene_type:complete